MFWLNVIYLATILAVAESANILTLIHYPVYSHHQPFLALSKALARKGHNLTVFTAFPMKEKIPNWTSVDLSQLRTANDKMMEESGASLFGKTNLWTLLSMTAVIYEQLADITLSLPNVQDFISNANKTKFDLIIIDDLLFLSDTGIVHKIGSPPVVSISLLPNMGLINYGMGGSVNPSYDPDYNTAYSNNMNFYERVHNTLLYWWFWYSFEYQFVPSQERILRKHFGPEPPSAKDFHFNKSLVLLTSDSSVAYPQQLVPSMIRVGPLHIKKPEPLPKDLEDWFNGAQDGVVFYSFGSTVKGSMVDKERQNNMLKAFAKFPKLRFLWKYESEEPFKGLPSNVMIKKWIPQNDVLAHKNLKLFISQVGVISLHEAINHGIPVLAIPVFYDQFHNSYRIVKEGAGKYIELENLNSEDVYEAIKEIVYDRRQFYKENALRLSNQAKDKMLSGLEEAVWWVEYVIRNNGTKHLRMASLDLFWFQRALIDVYAFLLLVFITPCFCLYTALKRLFRKSATINKKDTSKTNKNKKNK